MNKDANVSQSGELRVFAMAASNYGDSMIHACISASHACDEAVQSANGFMKTAMEREEAARQTRDEAEEAYQQYEATNRPQSDDNKYDSAVAARLRNAAEEAKTRYYEAVATRERVQGLNDTVRSEAFTLQGTLAVAQSRISQAASTAYQQVNSAASLIDNYNQI